MTTKAAKRSKAAPKGTNETKTVPTGAGGVSGTAEKEEEKTFMQVLDDPGQGSFKALDPSAQQRYRVWASAQPFTTSDGTEERGAKSKRGVGEAGGNARQKQMTEFFSAKRQRSSSGAQSGI